MIGLALALVLSGCAEGTSVPHSVPLDVPLELEWGTLQVQTTQVENEPTRGNLLVSWSDGHFAISAPNEPDVPRQALVKHLETGSVVASTQFHRGWMVEELRDGLRRGTLSPRIALWDLRALHSGATSNHASTLPEISGGITIAGSGTVQTGGLSYDYVLNVTNGRIVGGTVAGPARESPFTFHAPLTPFPQDMVWPTVSKPYEEVQEGDSEANLDHIQVIQLLTAYATNHGGTLPTTADADTLRVELLQSGKAWPSNAYSGDDLRASNDSGDFGWVRCSLQDGRFEGFGWDGTVIIQVYGVGCA